MALTAFFWTCCSELHIYISGDGGGRVCYQCRFISVLFLACHLRARTPRHLCPIHAWGWASVHSWPQKQRSVLAPFTSGNEHEVSSQ